MNMLPKASAKHPPETPPAPGTVVMYENQGSLLLGCVIEFKKNKYLIQNERGAEIELSPDRLHQAPGKAPASSPAERASFLASLSAQVRAAAVGVDLAELWSLIQEEQREYRTGELCENYYGRDELLNHLALRFALIADSVYFKRKKEFFQPRSAETVEELKKAAEAKQRKARIQQQTIEAFAARLKNRSAPIPAESAAAIELLEDLAAGACGGDGARLKEARDLLVNCCEKLPIELNGRPEERAYSLLRRVHHFTPFTNLSLIRHNIRRVFPAAVLEEAGRMPIPAAAEDFPDRECREDLTALDAFTVDDVSTKDMDDAISLERTASGWRLGIHISDVAAVLPSGGAIDREARRRTTSFYHPDGPINMLPERLSQSICSLVEGQLRPCLSFLWELDPECRPVNARFCPSLIKVKRRLSYRDVDRLLEDGHSDFSTLFNIAGASEAARFAAGGFKVNKREVLVVLQENGELGLEDVDENAPGRALIGELMVICNREIARFAAENKIPIVFRGQPPSDAPPPPPGVPPGPALDYLGRAALKPSAISFDPAPHSTLGLEAYTQATSPIRRYIDLCNQRQILWFLRTGAPLYSREEYEKIAAESEDFRSAAGALVKESRRFWLLKYLEQRCRKSKTIRATVLRTDFKTPLVELDEIFLPALVKLAPGAKPGDEITLRVARVDAVFDDLRLEPA